MIRFLESKEIDIDKYNTCITNSINVRIYAYSWYLDCVADNWSVLVFDDYKAIMPLPWRSKYFIKYIYPPSWTQQLGIFSKNTITNKLVLQFIEAIPRKFKKITIQFNSENNFLSEKVKERRNFILPLNKRFDELKLGFNKNRLRDLKKALDSDFIIDKRVINTEFLNFYLNTEKGYDIHSEHIKYLNKLLKSKNSAINIWGIKQNEKLIAGLLWLKNSNRITYLLPVATTEAKKQGLPTVLTVELIKQQANSGLILDFEGSMIPGVANFYKSFGAIPELYLLYQQPFKLFLKGT